MHGYSYWIDMAIQFKNQLHEMNQWFDANVLYKHHHWHNSLTYGVLKGKERKKSYLDINILIEPIHLIEQLK